MGKRVVARSLLDEAAASRALEAAGNDPRLIPKHYRTVARAVFSHERAISMMLRASEGAERGRLAELPEFSLAEVSGIPAKYAQDLEGWKVATSKLAHVSESDDLVTTKLLIDLDSGNQIEAVILRHNKRTTLCVSSQVGCKMGCTFCATGTLGQKANLTAGEILEQLILANRFLSTAAEPRQVTNVVFMGMGEPLNNYSAVTQACRAMTDGAKFSLGQSRVTISTVGVTNRMLTLHKDVPGVSLALSLHAPSQALRQKIIPTAGAYPIEKLMHALEVHLRETKRNSNRPVYVMIEYILLSGVNDMPEVAEELAMLLMPFRSRIKLNLIPYNPIYNPEGLAKTFVAPTESDIQRFWDIMQNKHSYFCTVRLEMGQDANAACGQLACISKDAKDQGIDIEDLYKKRKKPQPLKSFQTQAGTIVKKPRYKTLRYKLGVMLERRFPWLVLVLAAVVAYVFV